MAINELLTIGKTKNKKSIQLILYVQHLRKVFELNYNYNVKEVIFSQKINKNENRIGERVFL